MPHDPEFDRLIAEAEAAPFAGWDFSWLAGRRIDTPDPASRWDYGRRAQRLVRAAASVLDHGTGGGERLSALGPFPRLTVATEAYAPNAPIAAGLLRPLGVDVVQVESGCHDTRGPTPDGSFRERSLPFAPGSFDLVLAHSSAFCPAEVYRVLRPRGILLTAQGRPSIPPSLADVLEGPVPEWAQPGYEWDIDGTLNQAGFEPIGALDDYPAVTYRDIGAVVYFLLAVPWAITDFGVGRYRDRLYRLHLQMRQEGGFTIRQHNRLLEMRKPD